MTARTSAATPARQRLTLASLRRQAAKHFKWEPRFVANLRAAAALLGESKRARQAG